MLKVLNRLILRQITRTAHENILFTRTAQTYSLITRTAQRGILDWYSSKPGTYELPS
jgi:hypothetical protein